MTCSVLCIGIGPPEHRRYQWVVQHCLPAGDGGGFDPGGDTCGNGGNGNGGDGGGGPNGPEEPCDYYICDPTGVCHLGCQPPATFPQPVFDPGYRAT